MNWKLFHVYSTWLHSILTHLLDILNEENIPKVDRLLSLMGAHVFELAFIYKESESCLFSKIKIVFFIKF